ncbi:MAG: ATP-grasp domain-containing protein [Thermoanaerobaculia bacterium]
MAELTTIPDRETIIGFIRELVAFVGGRSPHAVEDSATLNALGIDGPRIGAIVAATEGCFGVRVPSSEIRGDIHTVGQLSEAVGAFVHDALRTQIPLRRERVESAASRRLLFIGGATVPEFERAAARRGWSAALFTYFDPATAAGPKVGTLGVIDHVQAVDWAQPLDVVRRIVELYGAGEIDRVVPDDEFGLFPAALATNQLGIPGPTLRAVRNTRDKLHMRRTLEEAGLGQLQYAVCRDFAEAQAFLDRVGGPIILKPVSGTGSEGVSRVASSAELEAAFGVAAGAAGFMGIVCEEYIEGPEVSLEGYSVGGQFVPVALTDKLVDERFLEIGHQQPSTHPESVFAAAADMAGRALRALGIENGVTHTEFRISERGPVLIETHTRMGGGHLHVLTRLSTGVDLADAVVAFSLGETVEARPVPQGHAAAIRYILGRPGKVRGVRVSKAEPGDGVHAVLGPPLGKEVTGRSSSRERLGHVIATGPTPELAGKAAEKFIAQIQVEYFD